MLNDSNLWTSSKQGRSFKNFYIKGTEKKTLRKKSVVKSYFLYSSRLRLVSYRLAAFTRLFHISYYLETISGFILLHTLTHYGGSLRGHNFILHPPCDRRNDLIRWYHWRYKCSCLSRKVSDNWYFESASKWGSYFGGCCVGKENPYNPYLRLLNWLPTQKRPLSVLFRKPIFIHSTWRNPLSCR